MRMYAIAFSAVLSVTHILPLERNARVMDSPVLVQTPPVWGGVDPAVLGSCSAEIHDRYALDGGDGFSYRTWHPLVDPSGCSFAHEHGDDPASQTNQTIRATPILFGYAGRRMRSPEEPDGHPEAHEGYKVFVANRGEVNDEGRTSLIDARIVAHMGTAAPRRFVLAHHSFDLDVVDSVGKYVSVRVMGNTGPAVSAPSDDPGCVQRPGRGGSRAVMSLLANCRQGPYEIWAFEANVGAATIVAMTAVFDPIGVRDPADPLRQVYAWDPIVDTILKFPGVPRDGYRGCDREAYFGPVYWSNKTGQTVLWTDAMGQPSTEPLAIPQRVSRHNTIQFDGSDRNDERQTTFKRRASHCGPSLGLKN